MGSQITNIRQVKAGITEGARVYAQLVRLGAKLGYLDIGGGLGIDYDGSQTDFGSSMNYTLQEYANDVIYHIGSICDEAEVPHPMVLSESGRAITAYHSVLVFNVVGVATPGKIGKPFTASDDDPQPLWDLQGTLNGINGKNLIESLHDAQQAFDQALSLFSLGYMTLEQRAAAENLFWMASRKISRHVEQLDEVPEELEGLGDALSDNYFCNFSLFQSLPDSWAIKQLFPVLPLHRLNERPTHRVVLEDITCDSDGRIDQFIDRRDVKRALPLHEFTGEDYYIGVFLVGAYQEILGDLHNLFGDTNAVHVALDDDDGVRIATVVEGDTVAEVIEYVEFRVEMLRDQLNRSMEDAISEGRVSAADARSLMRFYDDATQGYTYLEEFPVPHRGED
jgi:arginine decarboxylase